MDGERRCDGAWCTPGRRSSSTVWAPSLPAAVEAASAFSQSIGSLWRFCVGAHRRALNSQQRRCPAPLGSDPRAGPGPGGCASVAARWLALLTATRHFYDRGVVRMCQSPESRPWIRSGPSAPHLTQTHSTALQHRYRMMLHVVASLPGSQARRSAPRAVSFSSSPRTASVAAGGEVTFMHPAYFIRDSPYTTNRAARK